MPASEKPEAVSGLQRKLAREGGDSHLHHLLGLRALRPLRDLELDLLALFEGLEAVALDGAVVDEDVGRAGLLDEAVALRVVEPLDLTGNSRHDRRILLTIRLKAAGRETFGPRRLFALSRARISG